MPRSFLFVLALLALSLGLNIELAWKIKRIQAPAPPPNKVGVQVRAFSATDLDGHARDISFNTVRPTLIYYIDPECHWCKENSTSFATLAQAIENRARVLILSRRTNRMKEFLAGNHLPVPVLIVNSQMVIADLGLTATPQTFVINANGRVEHHWYGAYIGETRAEIEKAFAVHLPDA
jgi:peroxiredoxin